MTDSSPWRNAIADLPNQGTVVLVYTRGGTLLTGWLAGGDEWQAIHPIEAMPYTRRKPRDTAADPPAFCMLIPRPPWDPARTQH